MATIAWIPVKGDPSIMVIKNFTDKLPDIEFTVLSGLSDSFKTIALLGVGENSAFKNLPINKVATDINRFLKLHNESLYKDFNIYGDALLYLEDRCINTKDWETIKNMLLKKSFSLN